MAKILKCDDCGKYYFVEMRGWNQCEKFVSQYKDKEWSETCRPVL